MHRLAFAALGVLVACGSPVRVSPTPAGHSLVTVQELRESIQDPGNVWLLVGSRFGRSALYLDSLPADEVVAIVARDSITPYWGPTRLAVSIERCGWADTVYTLHGRRRVRQSAPCPWTRPVGSDGRRSAS